MLMYLPDCVVHGMPAVCHAWVVLLLGDVPLVRSEHVEGLGSGFESVVWQGVSVVACYV